MEIKSNSNINKNADHQLSKMECNAMRGIAILGIVLHNYCHWLAPIVKENEYQYNQHNVDWFNQVMSAEWSSLTLFHVISFFGHYGVPIFLFLSAYGLVMKYEQPKTGNTSEPTAISFIKYHWIKLFRMMIVGFAAFVLIDAITPGQHRYTVLDIIGQLGLFNNLLPAPDDIIWPGPYWFFGLMLQLYIVYRLFLYKRHWSWPVAFIIVCTIIQLACEPNGEALNRWRYNCVGGMLPFCLGLLYAKYMKPTTHPGLYPLWTIISLIAIYLLSLNQYTWFIVPVFVCTATLCGVKFISRTTFLSLFNQWALKQLSWIGSISAALFVSHPITRKIIIPISRTGDYWTGLLLYIVTSICLAWLFKELMKRIPSPKLT